MSGVAGGTRIQKQDVKNTFDKYVKEILENIPGFKKASLSGSVKAGTKPDYGDLDLVTWFEGDDKREVKQRLISAATSKPDSIIVPFKSEKYKGKKYYNSGEIITVLYPIVGKDNEYIQVDNIIALSEEEHGFKNNFLDLPAEKQGLLLGLAKVLLLEESPLEVFKRLNISDLPQLQQDEEFEFNISSGKLTLRKVKLDNFREVERQEIWSSTDWSLIQKLFKNFNIDGSFEDLLKDLKNKLKNPRSRNRVKGIFNSMVSVKSGEVGTPKGAGKEKALAAVNSLLEKKVNKLEEESRPKIALYAGGFKPPHKAHFNNAKFLADKVDKLIIFIGPKIREGVRISPEQSKDIWEVYSKYITIPTEIRISEITPIKDIYDFVDENINNYSLIITGALPEEMKKFTYFVKNKDKYPQVGIEELPRMGEEDDKFSASSIRTSVNYLKKGTWIPSDVKGEDREKVVNIAMKNTPNEKEIEMQEALDKTLNELFELQQPELSKLGINNSKRDLDKKQEKKNNKNEGSSGTAIAPQSVTRSSDRAKLVRVYKQLLNVLGDKYYDIGFNQDHIIIKNKNEDEKIGFDYTPYMSSILEYMMDQGMKILPLPEIKVREDIVESTNFFGRTAYYDPVERDLVLYTKDRHPKDVMRSFAHEMIHHKQNLEGKLHKVGTTNTNEDQNLLEIEKEAYLEGNIIFRSWEDSVKNK